MTKQTQSHIEIMELKLNKPNKFEYNSDDAPMIIVGKEQYERLQSLFKAADEIFDKTNYPECDGPYKAWQEAKEKYK